jgi:hypothetical protein
VFFWDAGVLHTKAPQKEIIKKLLQGILLLDALHRLTLAK